MWQNSKIPIVTKLKLKCWQNSNCDQSNCDKTHKVKRKTQKVTKLKLWQNLRTQIMIKLKNSSVD